MRNYMLPVLLAAAVGLPFLISKSKKNNTAENQSQSSPFYQAGFTNNTNAPYSTGFAQPGVQDFASLQNLPTMRGQTPPIVTNIPPVPSALISSNSQTLVFPGNAYGPDLTAAPMEFLPTTNLAEIFRFDIYPNWVKKRWERVSNAPATHDGLRGMRVALVTGTNSNDLHGSLTYHFDANQHLQRISFQGWAGDPSRLIKLLVDQFGFKQQGTMAAGLYVAQNWGSKKGVLILQDPNVIRSDNPTQQVAMVLEINNPKGKIVLSETVERMLDAAKTSR